MADSVSNIGYYGYNPYGYTKYSDDFMAQNVLNNNYGGAANTSGEKSEDNFIAFTGKSNEKAVSNDKESSDNSILWTIALVGGAILAGKYFNKIKGLFSKQSAQAAVPKAEQTLNNALNRVQDVVTTSKKHRITNTSVTGASRPVTNDMEAAAIQNINTSHTNANIRKLVNESAEGTVTPEMQALYDKEIAYKNMTQKQRTINNKNNAKNAAERAEKNSIRNNSKGGEDLENAGKLLAQSENAAKSIADGGYVNPFNKNTYYTQNGKVTKILLANGNIEVTDPKKIAKHLAKHNIEIENFATTQHKKLDIAA